MRKSDREIKGLDDIVSVMEKCDVCRLAFNDNGVPYIVPLNFGISRDGDKITLYFHSALEGKKLNLITSDNRAAFEMDCAHRLVLDEEQGNCTMEYESVIGCGRIEFVPDSDKLDALRILMAHYREENFPFNEAVVHRTAVYRLCVEELTGKARKRH